MPENSLRPFLFPLLVAVATLVAGTVLLIRSGEPPFIAVMNGLTFAIVAGGLAGILRLLFIAGLHRVSRR